MTDEVRLLVQPQENISEVEFSGIMTAYGINSSDLIARANVYVVEVDATMVDAVIEALNHDARIRFVEVDMPVRPNEFTPNDPRYASAWHLARIEAPSAWTYTMGKSVTVAVIDTGIDSSHPDLAAHVVPGWNIAGDNNDTIDINGHGTKVAGIVGAATDNRIGIASVAGAVNLMPVRVSDTSDGYAYFSTIARGMIWAADHGARIVNISYDATTSESVTAAAQYVRNKGGLVVVAGGNNGGWQDAADSAVMISVAGLTENNILASWSSYGDYIDVAAPGQNILTTVKGGGYATVSGTSFAAPVVTGIAALIMSVNPGMTPEQIESTIKATCTDLGNPGRDQYYGAGLVNAGAAVAAAMEGVLKDVNLPEVSIMPPASEVVSGVVTIDIEASDDVGVTRVDLYAGRQLIGSAMIAPYRFTWNTAGYTDGVYSVQAYAYDASGNVAQSGKLGLIVDNETDPADKSPPELRVDHPDNGIAVSEDLTIAVTSTDDVGVISLKLYIDDVLVTTEYGDTLYYTWEMRHIRPGIHTIRALAEDRAGNRTEQSVTVSSTGATTSGANDLVEQDTSANADNEGGSPTGGGAFSREVLILFVILLVWSRRAPPRSFSAE